MSDTYRLLGRKDILASLSGVHRELSWLLSVVRDTESDMRDGDEQLLLFWLLLATVSSSKESASSVNTRMLATEPCTAHCCGCAAGSALTFLILAQCHHFGLVDGDFDERRPHLCDLHLLLLVGQLLGVLRTHENDVTELLLKKLMMLLQGDKLPLMYTHRVCGVFVVDLQSSVETPLYLPTHTILLAK